MDLRLERDNIKRTYAACLMTILLMLGICLASISPYRLSDETTQRDGVRVCLSAFNIISNTLSAGEVSHARMRFFNLFAASRHIIAILGPDSDVLPYSAVTALVRETGGSERETRVHGVDTVARK